MQFRAYDLYLPDLAFYYIYLFIIQKIQLCPCIRLSIKVLDDSNLVINSETSILYYQVLPHKQTMLFVKKMACHPGGKKSCDERKVAQL
jgi:hypothetical protein